MTTHPTDPSGHDVWTHEGSAPIYAWTRGVPVEEGARSQLAQMASMPFIHRWVAVMPDVHVGIGATVGSVVATVGAVIPAAVGVDIGCGMMAVKTTLTASQLPDNLAGVRNAIERAVPHGFGQHKHVMLPQENAWRTLDADFSRICAKHKAIEGGATVKQLGTLGGGNHFIEVCVDEAQQVWFMLHSGSRGVGNRIGRYFIELAKRDVERAGLSVPHQDLSYLTEGTEHFADYVEAVGWAQRFASKNRELMMAAVVDAVARAKGIPEFTLTQMQVNCHHNYISTEFHYGKDVLVTRKGAVSAREGELGIIPGSMGARSFIVVGKGHAESFHSCSHGAGRKMSRTAARKMFTKVDHERATQGVECRKDAGVIDETPAAYKSIDDVMRAQRDLVDVQHTLKQLVCVKG
jgi:tRNA-splicing ligase RtcB